MKCDKVVRRFLELDNYTRLPFSIRLHVVFCKYCRREIKSLQNTFENIKGSEPFDMLDNLNSIIMHSIYSSPVVYRKNVSSAKWLTVGSVIFLSMLAITFSDSFVWLKYHFQEHLEIPFNIVMGLAITIYIAFYIGSHMDETKKLFHFFDKRA